MAPGTPLPAPPCRPILWPTRPDGRELLHRLANEGRHRDRAFTNDVLIAISTAQIGATLVHDNARDYEVIQRHYRRLKHTVGYPRVDG
jgi:predicted nucleic acid-binding protein